MSVPDCEMKSPLPSLLRVEGTHQLLGGADRGERETSADDLTDARDVGNNTVVLLGASVGEAKASDDLIEDEQDAVASSDLAQPGKEARLGRNEPLERFDDDGGELLGVRRDDPLDGGQVVVRSDEHLGLERVGNA